MNTETTPQVETKNKTVKNRRVAPTGNTNRKKYPHLRRERAVYPVFPREYANEIDEIKDPQPWNPFHTKTVHVFCGRRHDGARVTQGRARSC